MKTNMFKALLVIAMVVLAAACQQNASDSGHGGETVAKPEGNITDDTWTDPQVDSENLTDDAESLLAIDTLDQALEKFNQALKLNPSNARADVWVSFIKLELETKGILARVRPFVEAMPNGDYEYQKLVDNQGSEESVRRFYLDGPADIRTPDDFQEWIDRLDLRLTELRETFGRHKDEQIRLLVPTNGFLSATSESHTVACRGKQWGPIRYEPSDCSTMSAEFLLNRTDIEAVKSVVAAYQASMALANAYRLSQGSINRIKSHDYYEDGTTFGILVRDGAQLRTLQDMKVMTDDMRDFAIAARYIIDHQKEACPKDRETMRNRPGYLFGYGICINQVFASADGAERTTEIVNQILQHKPVTIFSSTTKDTVSLDVEKFISNPIADLNQFGPFKKGECGFEPNYTPIHPYVTNGDFDKFLLEAGVRCHDDLRSGSGAFKW